MPRIRVGWVAAGLMFLSSLSWICCGTTTADDGSMFTVGGAVRLMSENKHVRMLSEVVRAHVSREDYEAVVDCEFVMKNEGPADTVLVGFPDGARGLDSHQEEIGSFRSWVDGVEAECRRLPEADSTSDESDAPTWWTKRVVFPQGAVRVIRDRYTVAPGRMYGASGEATCAFWYVLWTGASWKGTIGSADISVTLDDVPPELVTGTMPPVVRDGRTYRWSFKDFEPGFADGSPEGIGVHWQESPPTEAAADPDSTQR